MEETTTSYGLTVDFSQCAWDLRDYLHDRGLQVIRLTDLFATAVPADSGAYFLSSWKQAKSLGRKASQFIDDLLDTADDDILCMGYWKAPGGTSVYALFAYEEGQDPSSELLDHLSRVLSSIADGASSTLTLEGLATSSGVSPALSQLSSHFGGDWGKVAQELCRAGRMSVEIATVGGRPAHAIRAVREEETSDGSAARTGFPSPSVPAAPTISVSMPIKDVLIPGYPPHAFVNKDQTMAQSAVATLKSMIRIEDWPQRCRELQALSGHSGSDAGAWLAIVARQVMSSSIAKPQGTLPGYVELPSLFDRGGRSIFALLKSSSDSLDMRPVLDAFVDYEGASANVALGARKMPDVAFHAYDYLSYLRSRAGRAAQDLTGGSLSGLVSCVSEGRAIPADLLAGLADYGEVWTEIGRVLAFLGKPGISTLEQVRGLVEEWKARAVRHVSVCDALREIIEQCQERFSTVVPWGHPVMQGDLASLDGSEAPEDAAERELAEIYEALVEEMTRDVAYGDRGRRLERVEAHFGPLGAMFDPLRGAFAADPVDLGRLVHALKDVPAAPEAPAGAGADEGLVPERAGGGAPEPTSEPIYASTLEISGLSSPVALPVEDGAGFVAEDDDPLIGDVPVFRPELVFEQGSQGVSPGDFDELAAFFTPSGPQEEVGGRESSVHHGAERERSLAPDLRACHGQEYLKGQQTGSPCDFTWLFELGRGVNWPLGEAPEGLSSFQRCALMGERDLACVLDCLEQALRDGVRPAQAFRILALARGQAPVEVADPLYQRYWALVVLAERLGVAGGEIPGENLLEDCDWLTSGGQVASGAACTALLVEAFFTTVAERLSGGTVKHFRLLMEALDDDMVTRCGLGGFKDALSELLCQLKKDASYSYSDEADYSGLIAPALVRIHVESRLEELAKKAEEKCVKTVSSSYAPAQTFWRDTLTQPGQMSQTMVGPLLDALARGVVLPEVDAEELKRLRRSVDDGFAADYRTLPRGKSTKPIEGSALKSIISRIEGIYDLYEELLELDEVGEGTLPFLGTARCLVDVHCRVLRVLEGLARQDQDGWGVALQRAAALQGAFPNPGILTDDVSADFEETALPPELQSERGRGLVELLLHATGRMVGGHIAVPSAEQLGERLSSCQDALERAFTFNVLDAGLHGRASATLARAYGVVDSLAEAPQDARATHAMLVQWALDALDTRVDSLCRRMVVQARHALEDSRGLDEQTRALLEDAVERGDIARIFAYTDYEMDSALLSFAEQPLGFEDEFYGFESNGRLHVGLVDDLCRAMESGGGQFSYVNIPFVVSVLPGVSAQVRANLGARNYQGNDGMRKAFKAIKDLIKERPLPIDGEVARLADDQAPSAARRAVVDVSHQLTRLFSLLGFEDASVEAEMLRREDGEWARGWTLRFFARPSETDSRGELVCPLREFVVLTDPPDGTGPARVEYEVLLFTRYERLCRAMEEERDDEGAKRLILYLDAMGSDSLTPARRCELMPARKTPRSSKAPGALLLDEALAAYLASLPCTPQANDRLSAFFRCALPFTAPRPYGDDVRKSVRQPPLFYGRTTILEQLRTGVGRTFIYGARRMGKTSILRELAAEERANRYDPSRAPRAGSCVAYVSLTGSMSMETDNFWTEFVGKSFVADVPALAFAHDAIQVQDALSAASVDHSFYLLLDEADELLRYDSFTSAQHPRNAIMNSLVDYMSQNPRFRVVMGGLHATMRYAFSQARENQTAGQLASSIVVGPLWEGRAYEDAARLVFEPLKTMGYVMEPQDVLKVLSKTCYFPNLINIVCEKLLDDLRRQRRTSNPSRVFVRIPSVAVDAALREASSALAEKFQLTIQLDPGYDMVVSALMLLEAQGEVARTAESGVAARRMFSMDEIVSCVRSAYEEWTGDLAADKRAYGAPFPWDDLEDDVEELVRFGILKKPDELISLRDGSMRTLVGGSHSLESAFGRLKAAFQSYLERDLMRDRMDEGERRNAIVSDGLVLYSPLNARDTSRLASILNMRGECVLLAGCAGGSQLLARHFCELLPSLCKEDSLMFVKSSELEGLLDKGLPKGLVVVEDGWGLGDLTRVRAAVAPGEGTTRVILFASPRTAWELADELADNEVVQVSAWSAWTRSAWAKNYDEHSAQKSGGIVQSRTQSAIANWLLIWCGGQAGAVAQVISMGVGTVYDLDWQMRAFSKRALLGEDFGWVLDGTCAEARPIWELWQQLAGLAVERVEHPLGDQYGISDWYGLLDLGCTEQSLEKVLEWMGHVGLARRVPNEGQDVFEMCDWFMHALLAALSTEPAEVTGSGRA